MSIDILKLPVTPDNRIWLCEQALINIRDFGNKFLEKEFQRHVVFIAENTGCIWYHNRSDITNMMAGFPDLVIVKEEEFCIFRELKRRGGRISDHQKKWHLLLESTGSDVDVWWSHKDYRKIGDQFGIYL